MDLDDRRFRILMEIAYSAIIEEIHKTTERVLRYHYGQRKIHVATVHPSLFAKSLLMPGQEFLRKTDFKIWGKREEKMEYEYRRDVKRLTDLLPIVNMLERWFELKKNPPPDDEFLGTITKKPNKKT